MGLAIAADEPVAKVAEPFTIEPLAPPCRCAGVPLVVDLSALWAGPLARSLLHMARASGEG